MDLRESRPNTLVTKGGFSREAEKKKGEKSNQDFTPKRAINARVRGGNVEN